MTELPDPAELVADAPRLREALDAAGWSAAALDELLGATARTHLDRDELAPLLRRTTDGSPLATLARLFVLGAPVELDEAGAAGVPETWLRPDGFGVSAPVRLQPVLHDGVDVTVPHDAGRAATGVHPDQVLGVGAASLTLAAATPRDRVGRVLDLGTGQRHPGAARRGPRAGGRRHRPQPAGGRVRPAGRGRQRRHARRARGRPARAGRGGGLRPGGQQPAVRREPRRPLHLPRRGPGGRRGVPAAGRRAAVGAGGRGHRRPAGQLAARRGRGRRRAGALVVRRAPAATAGSCSASWRRPRTTSPPGCATPTRGRASTSCSPHGWTGSPSGGSRRWRSASWRCARAARSASRSRRSTSRSRRCGASRWPPGSPRWTCWRATCSSARLRLRDDVRLHQVARATDEGWIADSPAAAAVVRAALVGRGRRLRRHAAGRVRRAAPARRAAQRARRQHRADRRRGRRAGAPRRTPSRRAGLPRLTPVAGPGSAAAGRPAALSSTRAATPRNAASVLPPPVSAGSSEVAGDAAEAHGQRHRRHGRRRAAPR